MDGNGRGISIGTISGGVVNFGGAVNITPISVTKTITGAGGSNSGSSGTGSCNGQSRGSSKARSGGTNSGSILTTNSECCIFKQRNWANIVDLIRRSIE